MLLFKEGTLLVFWWKWFPFSCFAEVPNPRSIKFHGPGMGAVVEVNLKLFGWRFTLPTPNIAPENGLLGVYFQGKAVDFKEATYPPLKLSQQVFCPRINGWWSFSFRKASRRESELGKVSGSRIPSTPKTNMGKIIFQLQGGNPLEKKKHRPESGLGEWCWGFLWVWDSAVWYSFLCRRKSGWNFLDFGNLNSSFTFWFWDVIYSKVEKITTGPGWWVSMRDGWR